MRPHGPILFLDFDGVAHPAGAGDFRHAEHVRAILARLSEACGLPASVVVSSTWRLGRFDPARAGEWLGVPASRIEGCTPDIEHRRRGAEILSWIESRGAHGRPWIVADDRPGLLGGVDLARRALLPASETGLSDPAWADAAACLVRAQAPGVAPAALALADLRRSWASLALASPASGGPGLRAPARELARQGAELGWLGAAEAAIGSAHAGDACGGAEICLAAGSPRERREALEGLLGMIAPGPGPASADLWDAAGALSRSDPELVLLLASHCMRFAPSRGASEPEAGAIRAAIGAARASPEALALARAAADAGSPLCLAALDGARAWGSAQEELLQSLERAALPAARQSLGDSAVESWLASAADRQARSRRRPAAGSARI